MSHCAICEEPCCGAICPECRADPWWNGMSTEIVAEHGRRCQEEIERGVRLIAQGYAPVDVGYAEPTSN